jgi:pyruvate ferredoxin oxidoreductase gamma subunit
MLEILIQGRGGQGAQTAGNQLATAFFAEGKFVQTFSTYGGARRGTPVSSFLRVDEQPIRRRCSIEHASAILCFDDSLLPGLLAQFADQDTLVVVNSRGPAEAYASLGDYRIVTIDGMGVAQNNDMGRIVNSALLGAFAGALGQPSINMLNQVVEETAPVKKQENLAACKQAYRLTREAQEVRI